jgi:undecaprenyl-diphosphatase
LGLSGVAVWAGAKAIKPLVGRARPAALLTEVEVRGRPQTGLGYPSGHAGVAASLAVVLAQGSTALAGLGLAAVAGTVAFGRVYTGAHLPLDAVGGLGLGVAAGTVTRWLLRG